MIGLVKFKAGSDLTMSPWKAAAIAIDGIRLLFVAASVMTIVAAPCLAAGVAAYNRPSAIYPEGNIAHGKELAGHLPRLPTGAGAPVIGDPPFHPPKLQHQRQSSIFYALEDYKSGDRKSDIMAPMVEGLSEQDMRDVSAYLAGPPSGGRPGGPGPGGPGPGAGGPERPPSPEAAASPGRAEVIQLCGFCHGMTGQGVMDGTPTLGGQYQDYLKHALADYISGSRSNPTMRSVVKKITPTDIEVVTTYLSAQSTLEVAR